MVCCRMAVLLSGIVFLLSGIRTRAAEVQPAQDAALTQVSQSEVLLFEEDFEKGADRWEVTDKESWALQDGHTGKGFGITRRQSAYEPEVRSPLHIALIKGLELDSFVVTFLVRSTFDTGNHRDCCVFFGHQDPSHFYYVHLGARPDPASGQIMVVDGAPRTPLTDNKKLVPWDDGWHKVKLVRDAGSGTISIFYDDMSTPHMTANDRRFGKGRIGIGSFDDMNAFDDIRIIELPAAAPETVDK